MILAANYMDIKSLLDLCCAKVASMIKGKTTEEIRKTFNIKNDFTPGASFSSCARSCPPLLLYQAPPSLAPLRQRRSSRSARRIAGARTHRRSSCKGEAALRPAAV